MTTDHETLAKRLTAMLEQVGNPDYSLKEFVRGVADVRDALTAQGGEQTASHEALHASAPAGHKCADCTMDKEPCPVCYTAWWRIKHPHTIHLPDTVAAAKEGK